MARCTFQRRVQHLRHFRPLLEPARQHAPRGVGRVVAQRGGGQRAQQQFGVVRSHAQAQAHVRELDAFVQRVVARADRAHQHVAAARGVLGQRLHHDVGAQRERIEGDARTPGVVDGRCDALVAAHTQQAHEVGKLHRHRAGGLDPHQLRLRPDHRGQRRGVHRVVQAVRDAPVRQLVARQLAAGAVDVGRQQHLVARAQQRLVHQRDGRQPAGHEHAVPAAFQRRDALFQRERGGRAVQAVGVAGLVAPVACTQRRGVAEQHGRRLVHTDLRRLEARRRLVGVVDQRRGVLLHAGTAIRSWPSTATMRAFVNSPTFSVREAFSGGSRRTVPSISGASA